MSQEIESCLNFKTPHSRGGFCFDALRGSRSPENTCLYLYMDVQFPRLNKQNGYPDKQHIKR